MKEITTHSEFLEILKTNRKVVVDFTATWCGPCKVIGPVFEKLSHEFKDITCIKVDVDANSETSEWAQISAMPTFIGYLDGKSWQTMVGANQDKLRETLEKLSKL